MGFPHLFGCFPGFPLAPVPGVPGFPPVFPGSVPRRCTWRRRKAMRRWWICCWSSGQTLGRPLGSAEIQCGCGLIPINTIFSGMNIHKSQLFWCELQGYKVDYVSVVLSLWETYKKLWKDPPFLMGKRLHNYGVTSYRILPSGYVKIAIENGHRNSGFSH